MPEMTNELREIGDVLDASVQLAVLMDRKRLMEWLKAQNPEGTFWPGSSTDCPISVYLKDHTTTQYKVWFGEIDYHGHKMLDMPQWANNVQHDWMAIAGAGGTGPITKQQAIDVLQNYMTEEV